MKNIDVVLKKLVEELDLKEFVEEPFLISEPSEPFDYFGYKYANALKIQALINFLETKPLDQIEKIAVMSLILHSYNQFLSNRGNGMEFWVQLARLLYRGDTDYSALINLWSDRQMDGAFLLVSVLKKDLKELAKEECHWQQTNLNLSLSELEVIELAKNVAKKENWPWLEPIKVSQKGDICLVVTNVGMKGRNVKISIDASRGVVISKAFLPR